MTGAQAGAWGCGFDPADLAEGMEKFAAKMERFAAKMSKHQRHGHTHHGRGPGFGGFGPGFGPGAWRGPAGPFGAFFGTGGPWGRGPKAKRGDVRAAILALLDEGPRNGYQIIQEINERSGGSWKPSPGAVYPALQQLADEGLVVSEEAEGRRTFRLTDAGRAYVTEHRDEIGAPWEAMAFDPGAELTDLFKLAAQCSSALVQVAQAGDDQQMEQAKAVLNETRRKLYRILAEDDTPGEE